MRLSSVENHFLKNSKTIIWKGRYRCCDKRCKKTFSLTMNRLKNRLVLLEIESESNKKDTHKSQLKSKTFCKGEKRVEQAKTILSLGSTLNTVNNNILVQRIMGDGRFYCLLN